MLSFTTLLFFVHSVWSQGSECPSCGQPGFPCGLSCVSPVNTCSDSNICLFDLPFLIPGDCEQAGAVGCSCTTSSECLQFPASFCTGGVCRPGSSQCGSGGSAGCQCDVNGACPQASSCVDGYCLSCVPGSPLCICDESGSCTGGARCVDQFCKVADDIMYNPTAPCSYEQKEYCKDVCRNYGGVKKCDCSEEPAIFNCFDGNPPVPGGISDSIVLLIVLLVILLLGALVGAGIFVWRRNRRRRHANTQLSRRESASQSYARKSSRSRISRHTSRAALGNGSAPETAASYGPVSQPSTYLVAGNSRGNLMRTSSTGAIINGGAANHQQQYMSALDASAVTQAYGVYDSGYANVPLGSQTLVSLQGAYSGVPPHTATYGSAGNAASPPYGGIYGSAK